MIKRLKRKAEKEFLRLKSKMFGKRLPFFCPCCNTYLRSFIDGGFVKRPERYDVSRYREMDQNVVCPICRSLPRHRIQVSFLNEHSDLIRNKKVLYFAIEPSVRIWMERKGISYITADRFHSADLQIDIEDTGLKDSSYGVIICNHVLEHVGDYHKALRELRRIVCFGGLIILSFPTDPKLNAVYEDDSIVTEEARRTSFGQADHLRVFGGNIKEMLEGVGFSVTRISGEDLDDRIKPVVGPADYDDNVLWCLRKDGE